jgi:hypothetical protein
MVARTGAARRFPNLSLMAIDILSIPPMSAETERLFSKAKLTITDRRGSMNMETLNLLECLRSWDGSALIAQSDVSFPNLWALLCTKSVLTNAFQHGYVPPETVSAMPDIQEPVGNSGLAGGRGVMG